MKKLLVNLGAAIIVIALCLACFWADSNLPFALPATPQLIHWLVLIAGLLLIVLAELAFLRRSGASGAPADPTHRLVVAGIYRWVRNPIYLGGALVFLGLALSRGSPTLLLVALLFIPLMDRLVVRAEEDRLERDFGDEYLDYQSKAARWIPKPPAD
jgi:protein-S-isoprenylcysteine O-methyltransferase Ste14